MNAPYPSERGDAVVRIEEHLAHTERTVEQLSEEIAELNRRMKQLAGRLSAIEARVTKIATEGDGSEDAGE